METPNKPKEKEDNSYMKYAGAGFQIISPVVLGLLVGMWLDGKYNTGAKYTTILSSVMIVVSLYLFIRQFLKR